MLTFRISAFTVLLVSRTHPALPQATVRSANPSAVPLAKINHGDANKPHGKREQSTFSRTSPVLGCVSKGHCRYRSITFFREHLSIVLWRRDNSPLAALTRIFSKYPPPSNHKQINQNHGGEQNESFGSAVSAGKDFATVISAV